MNFIILVGVLLWVVVGVVWLLPQKIKLLRRVGNLTNDQIIQLAKSGDPEAEKLRRNSLWFLVGSLGAVGCFFVLVKLFGG